MTLREDIIKYSGETLEEGKLGKVLSVAALVAALAFGAIKGVPAIQKYQNASSMSVNQKYHYADMAGGYEDIHGNYKYTHLHFKTWYDHVKGQPTLRISVYMNYYTDLAKSKGDLYTMKAAEAEILDQIDVYIKEVKANSSKIEKFLSKDTYIGDDKPLKIELAFYTDSVKEKDKEKAEKLAADIGKNSYKDVASKFGINSKDVEVLVDLKRI